LGSPASLRLAQYSAFPASPPPPLPPGAPPPGDVRNQLTRQANRVLEVNRGEEGLDNPRTGQSIAAEAAKHSRTTYACFSRVTSTYVPVRLVPKFWEQASARGDISARDAWSGVNFDTGIPTHAKACFICGTGHHVAPVTWALKAARCFEATGHPAARPELFQ
jgi:hypothetical protein